MKWIDINKRLPKKGDFVIIFTEAHYIEYCFEYLGEGEFYEANFDVTREVESDPLPRNCNVTHWIPCPLPPNYKP